MMWSTEMEGNAIPRMPSNLAAMNVSPGCLVASAKTWFLTCNPAIWARVNVWSGKVKERALAGGNPEVGGACSCLTSTVSYKLTHPLSLSPTPLSPSHPPPSLPLTYPAPLPPSSPTQPPSLPLHLLSLPPSLSTSWTLFTHSDSVFTEETSKTARSIANGKISPISNIGTGLGMVIAIVGSYDCGKGMREGGKGGREGGGY